MSHVKKQSLNCNFVKIFRYSDQRTICNCKRILSEVSIHCWRPPYCAEVQSSITYLLACFCLLAHPTLVGGVVSSQVEGLDRAPLTYLLVKDNCCCLLITKHSCLREKENTMNYNFRHGNVSRWLMMSVASYRDQEEEAIEREMGILPREKVNWKTD